MLIEKTQNTDFASLVGPNYEVVLRGFEDVTISSPGIPNSTRTIIDDVFLNRSKTFPHLITLLVASLLAQGWVWTRDAEKPGLC